MNGSRAADNLELVGGHLCLDFANTVSTRKEGLRRDYLTGYGDLVVWSVHAQILTTEEAGLLAQAAGGDPDRAAEVLRQATSLRETIYRVFCAVAERRATDGNDLALLNAAFRQALAQLEVRPSANGFVWTWAGERAALGRMLWPILRSAADLMTSPKLGRVRKCARDGCDWLFLDSSKNQSRRWCSMNSCGSRVKAQRYYRRSQGRKIAP